MTDLGGMARPSLPVSYWTLHLGGWAAFGLAWGIGRAGEMGIAEIVVREPLYSVEGRLPLDGSSGFTARRSSTSTA